MELRIARQWYETLKVSDGIQLIREKHVHPDVRCNIWHVRGREADLLIDSGLGVVSLRQYLSVLAEHEIHAVASHTHFDHIGCHHEFSHRLCHPAEAQVMGNPDQDNTVWSGYRTGVTLETHFEALPYPGFTLENYTVEPASPTCLINEGDIVDLGDRHFSVFHMPGHSPGSVCLYEAASKTLFTGDVLYDGELLDTLYHSDREMYRETLARLREFPAEVFHCGHYASFGRQRMLQLVDQYLETKS